MTYTYRVRRTKARQHADTRFIGTTRLKYTYMRVYKLHCNLGVCAMQILNNAMRMIRTHWHIAQTFA